MRDMDNMTYATIDLLSLTPGQTAKITTQNASGGTSVHAITATTATSVFDALATEIVKGFAVTSCLAVATPPQQNVNSTPWNSYVARTISVGKQFVIGRDEQDDAEILSSVVVEITLY